MTDMRTIITKQVQCEYENQLTLTNRLHYCKKYTQYKLFMPKREAFTSHCMSKGWTESNEYTLMWQMEISHHHIIWCHVLPIG